MDREKEGCWLTARAEEHRLGAAALLVAKGCDVNVRDYRGRTPLHYVLAESLRVLG